MMKNRTHRRLLIGLLLLASVKVTAQEVGPKNGCLVIAGGGVKDPAIFERFIDLVGDKGSPIVIIPTAGGKKDYGQDYSGKDTFQKVGATNVTVLHTYDRRVADTDEFVSVLREAKGVWFAGGRQWRLADAYLDTKVHKELWALLERGGVIGGSSAGATIQGSYLARGDTKANTIMMGDHEVGFGFLKNAAVDQHLLKRNRQFDLIEIVEAHRELLGIGIDENTAIVVHGDNFEVIGHSYVAIYDHNKMVNPGGKFYFLAPGDEFDLKTREPSRRSGSDKPASRVVKKKWKR